LSKPYKKKTGCESPTNCEVRLHLELQRTVHGDFVPKVSNEQTTDYWQLKARNFVDLQLKKERNENVAKNVILYLGDGMGISTQTAARAYLGGEEKELAFELFPNVALSKVTRVHIVIKSYGNTYQLSFQIFIRRTVSILK
jgi:alkaline phosphatase